MKKITLFLVSLFIVVVSFAATGASTPPLKANELFIPVGKDGKTISLLELSQIKTKDFEKLTGKKMNFFDRLKFKLAQRDLRRGIRADGTVINKRFEKLLAIDGTTGFHLGGFALGFFLGLIGVLIAYLINDEKKQNRVKWSWIGLGVAVIIYILILI